MMAEMVQVLPASAYTPAERKRPDPHLMNRPYSSGYFLRRLAWIRKAVPEVTVTTDVMVGFPKETREDFQNTLEAVKAAGFSKLHVFKYSKRAETLAASHAGLGPATGKEAEKQAGYRIGKENV
ncbi:MAG: hypothetical protein U5N58_00450 [Actinomycetota bacterium]|nr:hypothetical protein [Actinomycetota bacterium]